MQTTKKRTNRIVFFSGGLSSFAVAHHLKINHPQDNIVLYFTDTLWEDDDLYRFIYEVSDKVELPLLIHSKNVDPVQMMIRQHAVYNSRIGNCSILLKMRPADAFLRRGVEPEVVRWINKQYLIDEDFRDNPTLYFGISFDEFHRTTAIKKNWEPFNVEFPLCKIFYDYDLLLKQYDIKKPNLYLKGFTHNNCKGRCVKAGKSHFRLLFNEDNETFNQLEEIERLLSQLADTYHQLKADPSMKELLEENDRQMNMWHDSGYKYKPKLYVAPYKKTYSFLKDTTLTDIKNQMEVGCKLDLFGEEMGGCGCFVDYEDSEEIDEN